MIKQAWKLWREERALEKERRERFQIATAFNKRMTLKPLHSWRDGRWMCPECLTVHECIGWEPFCGSHYPACCSHSKGHVCWESCAVPPWA